MRRRRRARRNPVSRSPFGLGVVGLLMLGTGIVAVLAWKNMSDKDKTQALGT